MVFRDDLDLTAHMLKEHGGITGSNNRVIIGSNSHHHFSQLSTFNEGIHVVLIMIDGWVKMMIYYNNHQKLNGKDLRKS